MEEIKINLENLKKIVKEKNKTLISIAVELEVSQEALSQYISGKTLPRLSVIIRMAKYLNTSTDYLLGLTNNPAPNDFVLDEREFMMIDNYRTLSYEDKIRCSTYIEIMADFRAKEKKKN